MSNRQLKKEKFLRKKKGRQGQGPYSQNYPGVRITSLSAWPPRTSGPVNFYDTFSVTSTGTTATQTIKLNSLADSGVTYRGISGYSDRYARYRVLGYDLTIKAASRHATINTLLTTFVTNQSGVLTAAQIVSSPTQPLAHGTMFSTITGGADNVTYHHKGTIARAEGTNEVKDSTDYAAIFGVDPGQLLYLQTGLCQLSAASMTYAVDIWYFGTLYCEFFDRLPTGS
jgi:hypothetical protein